MSEIKISVQLDNCKNHLHVKEVSEETLKDIAKSFFSAVGIELPTKPVTFAPLVKVERPEQVKEEKLKQQPVKFEEVKSRSKQLPLIDSNRTLTTSIGDALKSAISVEQGEQPEYYITGIKVDEDGTKRYKCRYSCDCGRKGNHYIPLGVSSVHCHDCNTEIEVEPATFEFVENNVPERDHYGNFFLARFSITSAPNF